MNETKNEWRGGADEEGYQPHLHGPCGAEDKEKVNVLSLALNVSCLFAGKCRVCYYAVWFFFFEIPIQLPSPHDM